MRLTDKWHGGVPADHFDKVGRHTFHDPETARMAYAAAAIGAVMRVAQAQPVGPASPTQHASNPSGQVGSQANGGANTALSFVASARRHREQFPLSVSSGQIGANAIASIPEQAVPAYGFLRGLWIRCVASGGSGTSVAGNPDAPFNVLGPCSVTDPDGAPIWSVNSGYTAMLIHKYGGYKSGNGVTDPRADGFFTGIGASTGNFQFQLWVPLEIIWRNGLGSLPNTDSGKQYKLNISTNPVATVYSTAPATTVPTLTISTFIDCWTQPPATDVLGRKLTQVPPLVGSTQYWSRQSIPVNAGQSNGQTFGRVGNIVRGFLFVYRTAAGARSDTNWPSPVTVYRDGYNYDVIDQSNWQQEIALIYGLTGTADAAGGRDVGVYPYMFHTDFDGQPGNELRQQYWPTLQSSRIELDGSYGAAGTLEVITNDIAPAGDLGARTVL